MSNEIKNLVIRTWFLGRNVFHISKEPLLSSTDRRDELPPGASIQC